MRGPSFEQIWIPTTQGFFVRSLVEMLTDRWMDRRTTDDRWSEKLTWAFSEHFSYAYFRVLFLACDGRRRGDPNATSGTSPREDNSCWFKKHVVFSTPEPKAEVSCPFSVVVVVNFSHFHLLLQNHWAEFNQTWHKASLGEGNSSLFKWRAPPFSKGR